MGVARQYCGVLGKQDNCQIAVSVSLACEQASIPVAWQLYVPREWIEDDERREKAGIPAHVGFETKPQIALRQIEALLAAGAPRYCVLADAGYGIDNAFRQHLDDLGLSYMVGITSALVVWAPGIEPLPPKPYGGMGRPPVVPRRTRARQPVSVKELAHSLPATAFTTRSWREGSNETLSGRFAAVRVRYAGGNTGKARLRPEQWLLIEWPADDVDPLKYYLSNLPADTALAQLVAHAHMRWRIERLPGPEAGAGPWALRRPRMARVSSPCSTGHCGLRVSALRAPRYRYPGEHQKKLRSTPDTWRSRRLRCTGKSTARSATQLTRLPPFATSLRCGWSPPWTFARAAEVWRGSSI